MVLQLHFDRENRIGPGKIELLERIDETGSISAAGRAMDMSYRRAWLLVDAMNRTFNAPVVATRIGGALAGRARLTPLGCELVKLYREIGEAAETAAKSRVTRLEHLIGEGKERVRRKDDPRETAGHEDGSSPPSVPAQGNTNELRDRRR